MNILIADANPETRDQLRMFLEGMEHQVCVAENGEEALERFKEEKDIQAVFSGLVMPKLGGLELLKELKLLHRKLPFVILIPLESPETARQALRLGACDFLIKPFSNRDLYRTLKRVNSLTADSRFSNYCLEHSVLESRTIEMENDFEYISSITTFITRNLPKYELLRPEELFTIRIVLKEALENALLHGNLEMTDSLPTLSYEEMLNSIAERREEDPYRNRRVLLSFEISRNAAKYVIRDEGKGFDVQAELGSQEPEDIFQNTGKGLLLITNFMHEVFWNDRGNEITMIRYRKRKKN
jgi:CheY-like chemotaxis protein